jgi:hypothetical protein
MRIVELRPPLGAKSSGATMLEFLDDDIVREGLKTRKLVCKVVKLKIMRLGFGKEI